MKTYLAAIAAVALSAGTASAQSGIVVALNIGPSWPASGDSFILRDDLSVNSFGDDFDTGFSFGGAVAGPLSGYFGWRGEFNYTRLPADADRANDKVEGDYWLTRFQGGVQIQNFEGKEKGMPYGFFTLGLVHEDGSLQITTDAENNPTYDFDGRSAFGISLGGGYSYLIGENWGVGGDLNISGGFFDDSTRWTVTPSGQVIFKF